MVGLSHRPSPSVLSSVGEGMGDRPQSPSSSHRKPPRAPELFGAAAGTLSVVAPGFDGRWGSLGRQGQQSGTERRARLSRTRGDASQVMPSGGRTRIRHCRRCHRKSETESMLREQSDGAGDATAPTATALMASTVSLLAILLLRKIFSIAHRARRTSHAAAQAWVRPVPSHPAR